MTRIRAGDPEALRLLLEEAWAPLVRYLTARMDSPEDAHDAAQEAFVRLWEHRERWTEGTPRAVLFRIGRNLAMDRSRRLDVRRRWAGRARAEPPPGPATPEEMYRAGELEREVSLAVQALPERRRDVFELVRYEGLAYREVARVLGVSVQTVANQMSLALRDLRARLAAHLPDAGEMPDGARSNDG
ncbi:MAG: sigma-70 family RNA polymerase sigma factor [Longimicrobiales bacterium]